MSAMVLHHAALPHRGGAVRVARLLAQAQGQAGVDARVSFEVAENDPEASATQAGAIALLGPTPPQNLGPMLAALPQDTLLHLHTSTDWPALLCGLPQGLGRRLRLTLHDATPLTGGCAYPLDCPHFPVCQDPCPRLFANARARQAEVALLLETLAPVLVSPSRWLAGLARQTLPGLRARIIPNGIAWPQPDQLPARARARTALGIMPGQRVALFAAHGGTRAAYKSGPGWADCWRALRAQLPHAVAFAVGGDEASSQDGLTLWPYVDRAKLALLMRAADVLVYPALADNHPLVLMEAAAMELPVVSYSVGGVPEIVIHGETGLLAAAGDGQAFRQAALKLLADPVLCRRLGQAARAHAAGRFSAARMAADYAALSQ